MSRIADKVWALAEPVVKNNGCELWDIDYVKEAGQWFLRVYIDRPGEGVFINDCEAISRELDIILDEADPIPDSYIFEVSSAGAERQLKRPRDFERYMGSNVEVKLYKPLDGAKLFVGELSAYDNGVVTINAPDGTRVFEKNQVAQVRLRIV